MSEAQEIPVAKDGVLTVSGSIRLRYETLAGQARAGLSANDDLESLRTTLFAEYKTPRFWVGAELYDSRAYGGDAAGAVSATDVNALELAQAYIGVDVPLIFRDAGAFSLEAGRFILNLGSRRLVAADDYRNTTTTLTGLRADFQSGDLTATGIYVLPNLHRPDDKPSVLQNAVAFDRESFDLVLWGGIVTRAHALGGAALDFSFFHLAERDAPSRPTRDRVLSTLGPRLFLAPKRGRFDYEIEGFYQFGTTSDGLASNMLQLDVSARFLHLNTGYTFAEGWQPWLSLEYDYASGDGPGSSYNRFDTLFGMRRADFAPYGIYGVLTRTNVATPGVRLEVAPSDRFDWFCDYRVLFLASRTDAFSSSGVRDATGRAGSFAGQQIEGRIRYWLVPRSLVLEVDAVLLFKGRFLETAPNAPPTGDTRYVSFNLTSYF